jgi:phenylpropionate dioxygenase-like ring-hydroxylating dioxygenase large terminal subunit
MTAPSTNPTGRWSVAFPRRFWYPVMPSAELGHRRPRSVDLWGTPLAVFRDSSGAPKAVVDRCPHRNVPLSLGRVTAKGHLACAYHGWRFDGEGRCMAVPGLAEGGAGARPRSVTAHPACERDGFVWVWADPEVEPTGEPFRLPHLDGPGCGRTVLRYDLDCTLHAALENALDVPHTAFLHRGVFRGGEPREITAVRRPVPGGVEVSYEGEPVGMGRFRARSGTAPTFEHWDRFFLPSVAQVEYRVAGWLRIVNTILHLPLEPFRTRAWFVVQYWTRLPAPLVAPVVAVRGRRILGQDARMLAAQTANIRRFGNEQYSSTDLDVMGRAVWALLRRAERAEQGAGSEADDPGDPADDEPVTRTVTLRV